MDHVYTVIHLMNNHKYCMKFFSDFFVCFIYAVTE